MFSEAKKKNKPGKKRPGGYDRHKSRVASRLTSMSAEGRDIGEIPPIANLDRRESCRDNLRLFCETYNSVAFYWPWSPDHLTVLARIEEAIRTGGLFAFAMPRGSGKTSICRSALLWAAAYSHVRYPYLIGATQGKAEESLDAIKIWMRFNTEFVADFPEICVAVRALKGIANKASGQTCLGESTGIEWSKDRVVLPTVPPPPNLPGAKGMTTAPTSGTLIGVSGLTGEGIRGSLHTLQDGRLLRPDFVLLDDPQTDKSAASPSGNNTRESLITGAVLGMAGPDKPIAAVMPCTVIAPDDMIERILDRERHPMWRGEKTRMLRTMPTDMAAWEKYFETYRACAQLDPANYQASTAYYEAHRVALDAGAEASWSHRMYPGEVSAIQHAMNLYCRKPEAFFCEYQNDPRAALPDDGDNLDLDDVAERGSATPRGTVPLALPRLVSFIDVQGSILYWVVLAIADGYTCHVVDYGTWPDQRRQHFTYANARVLFEHAYPRMGEEAQLLHAMEDCTSFLLGKSWSREGGGAAEIERLMIDAGWGGTTGLVYQACRESPHKARLMPSHGRGIKAKNAPMDLWSRATGDQVGTNWRIRTAQRRGGARYCLYDTDFFKQMLMRRFRVARGDAGAITLFKGSANQHRMFAEHITAERSKPVESNGRRVHEFDPIPNRDNHLLDCTVGCLVAASVIGVAMDGMSAQKPPREKIRLSDIQAQRRAGR